MSLSTVIHAVQRDRSDAIVSLPRIAPGVERWTQCTAAKNSAGNLSRRFEPKRRGCGASMGGGGCSERFGAVHCGIFQYWSKTNSTRPRSASLARHWRIGRYFPQVPFLICTAGLDVCRSRKRTIHFDNGRVILRPRNHDVGTQEIVFKAICCLVKFRTIR
jgi:hypothetical protein